MIMGPRVGKKHLPKRLDMFLIKGRQEFFTEMDRSPSKGSRRVCKTGKGIRMTVGKGQVGFDVEDRRSVHKVCTFNLYYRTFRSVQVNANNAH